MATPPQQTLQQVLHHAADLRKQQRAHLLQASIPSAQQHQHQQVRVTSPQQLRPTWIRFFLFFSQG
jgi:hypothetical protein